MSVWSAITAGVGSAFDRIERGVVRNREYNRQDNAIQRRVADAKKAGVHPLFALGAQGAGSRSSVGGASGGGATGARIGEAIDRSIARKNNAEAKKAEAESYLASSQAAQFNQALMSRGRDLPANLFTNNVEEVPATPISKSSATTEAGNHAAFRNVTVPGMATGKPVTIRVPSQESGLLEVTQELLPALITWMLNKDVLNEGGFRGYQKRLNSKLSIRGKSAKQRWNAILNGSKTKRPGHITNTRGGNRGKQGFQSTSKFKGVR